MKILDQEKMERIKALLKTHPRGLSITNLASITGMNRNLIAKYLDMLVISGQVEIQQYGPAKVFFLSQRIPVSAMIEITSDLVMVLDQDRKIIHVNKPFTQFLALKREDLIGKTIGEVGHPFLSSIPLPEPAAPLDTREGGIIEVRYAAATGECFFRIKRAPAVFEDGAVGLTLIIEDITEQRRYQENLRLSEARYRGIVQDQTEFINRYLPDTTLTFVNEAVCQYLNCRQEDLVGKRFIEMLPDEERQGVQKALGALSPRNSTGVLEHRMMDGRGQMRWVHWTNRAIFDDRGVIREFQGMGRDITDQRETAERISRYILQLEFISRKAVEFVHSGPGDDLYVTIARGVKSLCPEAGVCVLSSEGEGGRMKVAAVLDDEVRNRIRGIIGRDLVGMQISPAEEIMEKIQDGILHRVPGDHFSRCLPSPTPEEVARLRESFGNVDSYIMGLTHGKDLFGGVLLTLREGVLLQHEHLLMTYLNQASVAVQRQIYQEELRRSQEEYRRIVENAEEGIWVLDRDYRTTFVNPRLGMMLGYSPEELSGRQIEEFMLPEDIPAHHERIIERRKGVSGRFEQRFRRKDGSLIWTVANATPLMEGGAFAGAVAIVTDITEQKKAGDALRESEAKFRTLIEASVDGICLVDEEGSIISCNRAMEEVSGIPKEEALGKPIWEVAYRMADPEYGTPDLLEEMRSGILETLRTGNPSLLEGNIEYPVRLPDGSRRIVQISSYVIPYGARYRLGSIVRDITFRKKAEDALRESEGKYRALVEQANDMIVVVQDGVMKFCNRKVAEMWGGDVQEIVGQPYDRFIDPAELPRVRENYIRRMAGEEVPQLYNTLLVRQDGSRVHADLGAGTITYEGRPADLIVLRDITEMKEAEEQLKQSHDLQQAILNASPVGIGVTTGQTLQWANRTMDLMLGYDQEELKGQPSRVLFADDGEYERALQALLKEVEARSVGTVQTVWKRKDGTRLDIALSIAPVRPGSPEIVAIAHDITARKKAEEELRRTHALQEAILAASPVGIGVTSNRVLIWSNNAMYRIHGYGKGELDGKLARVLYDDDREYDRVTREILGAMESGEFRETETVWRRKDGSRILVQLNAGPIRPGSPETITVVQDITARRKAEQELDRTRALQEAILSASPLGIGVGSEEVMIWGNEAMPRIHGYSREELEGQPARMMYEDEGEYQRVNREILGAIESGQFRELETVWRKKDGSRVEISLNVGPIRPGSTEILAMVQDITARKKAERALRESEETFRTMVDISPLPLSLIDATGKYLHVNPAFTRLFGYTLEDIPDGKTWFAKAFPDDDQRETALRLWKADAADHPFGEVRPRTFQVLCKDGSCRDILFLPAATPAGLQVVVYRDITGQKIHARLQESEELYRHLVEDLNIGIYRSTGDPDGRFIWGNTGLVSILGFENLADLQGLPVRDLFQKPGGRKALLRELQEKKFVKNRLLSLRKKDGTPVKVSVTALAEFDGKGNVRFITGLVQEAGEKGAPSPGAGST
jgi:PAS domain S-box-containing protein